MNKMRLRNMIESLINEDVELAASELHLYLNEAMKKIIEMDDNEKSEDEDNEKSDDEKCKCDDDEDNEKSDDEKSDDEKSDDEKSDDEKQMDVE